MQNEEVQTSDHTWIPIKTLPSTIWASQSIQVNELLNQTFNKRNRKSIPLEDSQTNSLAKRIFLLKNSTLWSLRLVFIAVFQSCRDYEQNIFLLKTLWESRLCQVWAKDKTVAEFKKTSVLTTTLISPTEHISTKILKWKACLRRDDKVFCKRILKKPSNSSKSLFLKLINNLRFKWRPNITLESAI